MEVKSFTIWRGTNQGYMSNWRALSTRHILSVLSVLELISYCTLLTSAIAITDPPCPIIV